MVKAQPTAFSMMAARNNKIVRIQGVVQIVLNTTLSMLGTITELLLIKRLLKLCMKPTISNSMWSSAAHMTKISLVPSRRSEIANDLMASSDTLPPASSPSTLITIDTANNSQAMKPGQ